MFSGGTVSKILSMAAKLFSYAEAAEQVQRYILALGDEGELGDGTARPVPPISLPVRGVECVELSAALGRVLAEAIRADRDQPPFPRATRDGFACRAAEANTNQFLFQAGAVRAGETSSGVLGPGEVWEIMTGAAVPPGADAVFMVEHSEIPPDSPSLAATFVRLRAPRTIAAGENIVPRGAEAQAGDLLLPPGVRIGPAQIALAAQCGYAELAVAVRPSVAILSTGDELVAISDTPGPTQIRNSNAPMLAALVAAAGGKAIILPVASDTDEAANEAVRRAMSSEGERGSAADLRRNLCRKI